MLKSVATATICQVISLGVSLLDRFLLSALLLRAWGVPMFEDWSVLLAAAGLMNLFDFGLYYTFSNAYTQSYQNGLSKEFERLVAIGVGISFSVFTAGVAVLLGWAFLGEQIWLVNVKHFDAGTAGTVLALLGGSMLIQTVTGCIITIYRATANFSRGLTLEVLLLASRTVALISIPLFGGTPVTAAFVYFAITSFFVLAVFPLDLSRNLNLIRFRIGWPSSTEWRRIGEVAPWFYAQHATTHLLLGAPLLFLGALSAAPGMIAMFVFVRMITNFARTLLQFASISIGVELSRLHATGIGADVIATKLAQTCRFMSVLCGTICGTVWILAEPMALVWSKNAISVDHQVLLIFIVALLLIGPFILISAFLGFIGRARIGAISKLATGGIALAICAGGFQSFGVIGIAVAISLGDIVGMSIILLPSAAKLLQTSAPALALKWLMYSVAGLVPLLLAGQLLAVGGASDPLQTMLLGLLLLGPVAALTLWTAGISGENRAAVQARAQLIISRLGTRART